MLSRSLLVFTLLASPALAETPITALPYTISVPGSYYLASNLSGNAGITISANDVTLDLRGHQLRGAFGAKGIHVTPNGSTPRTGIAIRNGEVRGWTTGGIDAGSCMSCRFDDLSVSGNGYGLLAGKSSVIRDAVANGNTDPQSAGIYTMGSCTIESCTASQNAGGGIYGMFNAVIRGCTTFYNGQYGFSVLSGQVSECSSIGELGFKIGGVGLRNCKVETSAIGIEGLGSGSMIEGNSIIYSGPGSVGIKLNGTSNTVVRNHLYGAVGVAIQAVAGNIVGPFVDATTVGSSSNPHANYR